MMKNIRLTKISDDHFNGQHPNGVNAGHEVEGLMDEKPIIGNRFNLVREKEYLGKLILLPVFSTSLVASELDENNEFKTTYSTYKIEYLDGKESSN